MSEPGQTRERPIAAERGRLVGSGPDRTYHRGVLRRARRAGRRCLETQTEFERLELKFLIDEPTAGRIRTALLATCEADKAAGGGYPVTSLYFDSPGMAFHLAKLRNAPDRFKLRARVYGASSPVFLEVKRKVGDVVIKRRVVVAREGWADSAVGFGEPLDGTARSRELLEQFAVLLARTGAEPRLLVDYVREAYASSVDRYARVTFDRVLRVQEQRDFGFEGEPGGWAPIDGAYTVDDLSSPVVLELKCEARMPRWMTALITNFELRFQGFSKYSNGIAVTERESLGLPPPQDLAELGEA